MVLNIELLDMYAVVIMNIKHDCRLSTSGRGIL